MQLLLAPDDIGVELFAVLADRELLVVVERDVNMFFTDRLIVGIMELSHVRMLESIFRARSLLRIKLEQLSHEI